VHEERKARMKFELIMNGQPYAFCFGMGFLKTINAKATTKVPNSNYSINTGLKFIMAQVMDGDLEALAEVLMTANAGMNPRLKQKDLYEFLEDEDTDIEEVFDTVIDFFGKANVTKTMYKELTATEK
jgi:hypothetical protein